jgi:uracil-DNA glycosylase
MEKLVSLAPPAWRDVLPAEFEKPYWRELESFLDGETQRGATVFPPRGEIFAALRTTPPDKVKVFLLGQDPYHDDGQAHGLCFSVREGTALPRSLVNIFKELASDLGAPRRTNGCLSDWAEQGVLLLNTVLTVRAHEAASHSGKGWENFTDAVIHAVSMRTRPAVFVLWGGHALKKESLIDGQRHTVIKSAHPSPLSASRGFFGSRPFSKINAALESFGEKPIVWSPAPDRADYLL